MPAHGSFEGALASINALDEAEREEAAQSKSSSLKKQANGTHAKQSNKRKHGEKVPSHTLQELHCTASECVFTQAKCSMASANDICRRAGTARRRAGSAAAGTCQPAAAVVRGLSLRWTCTRACAGARPPCASSGSCWHASLSSQGNCGR